MPAFRHILGAAPDDMKEIHYPVLVHSCKIRPYFRDADSLKIDERYVERVRSHKEKDLGKIPRLDPEKKESWEEITEKTVIDGIDYFPLPKSCRCRRYVTYYQADEFIDTASAMRIVRSKNGRIIKDEDRIWLPIVRGKVPRIDLTTRADIERAYCGSERKSKSYIYNVRTHKFEFNIEVVLNDWVEGTTEETWVNYLMSQEKMEAEAVGAAIVEREAEDVFENRIRKQYRKYIELCHRTAMDFRAKLIVPFREDPFDGRTILTFGPDMRTLGGHS